MASFLWPGLRTHVPPIRPSIHPLKADNKRRAPSHTELTSLSTLIWIFTFRLFAADTTAQEIFFQLPHIRVSAPR